MCGIIGYLGEKNSVQIIYEGLCQLEYRGYDSSGIVVSKDKQLYTAKSEGKLKELKPLLDDLPSTALVGMGHTRWATHGRAIYPKRTSTC